MNNPTAMISSTRSAPKTIHLLLMLLAASLFASVAPIRASPKAYDLVRYTGRAGHFKISFNYADGYPGASTLTVTDESTGAVTNLEHQSESMAFVPEKPGGKITSVTFTIDVAADTPEKMKGALVSERRRIFFTLIKSK